MCRDQAIYRKQYRSNAINFYKINAVFFAECILV